MNDEPKDNEDSPLSADENNSAVNSQPSQPKPPEQLQNTTSTSEKELFSDDDDDDSSADGISGLHDYEKVPQEVLDKALEQVKSIASGNNIVEEDITLKEFEGRVHRFRAIQHYTLEHQVTDRDMKGRMQGTTVGSRDEAMREIENHLEKMSQDNELIRNTIQVLKGRKDLGFALDNEVIKLDKYKKTYVIHSKCSQCGGSATTNCSNCQGRREVVCQRCHGEQTYTCHVCNGSQFVNGPEGRKPCMRCQGRGRITCEKCHGKGMMVCHICKGTGNQQCNSCNATGMMSHVVYMQVNARSKFAYDKQLLPPELIEQIELLGPDIVTKKHGEVHILEDNENLNKDNDQDKRNEYHITYQVKIPFGDIEFSLKDKPVTGKLFGYRPKLLQIPPFVEKLAAKGFKHLSAAAKGQGNIVDSLKKSLKYNVLRDILFHAATQNLRKADRSLAHLYPFGIRQKAIRDLLQRSNAALTHVTKKPATQGMAIGAGAGTALLAAYYLSPIHGTLAQSLHNPEIEFAIDAGLLGLACTASLIAFRMKCKIALKDLFGENLKEEQLKKLSPATPPMIYGVFGGIVLLQIILMELGLALTGSASIWYQILRSQIGL